MIKKIVLLFILFTMVLAACAPATAQSTQAVIEPTQKPTQEPTVIVPTVVPTQESTEAQSGMMSILDTIKADENLSLFYEALTLSGAVDILKGKGPFTVFAPTNDAINAVPNLNSMEQYGKIIQNHIFTSKFMMADMSPGKMNLTIPESGEPIVITVEEGVMHLHTASDANGNSATATVITADIETTNGVLYVIDAMLLPQTK